MPTDTQPLNLTATASIELVAASDSEQSPLPRFQMTAYTGGSMRIAGWRHPVVVDLAGLNIPSQTRPIRFGHDVGSGVGHTDSIRIDGGRLVATGAISRDTAAAHEVVSSSKKGFPWQASIGTSVEDFEFVQSGQRVLVNGKTVEGPVNVIRRATLGEISFVDLGADSQTTASVAAQAVPDGSSSTNHNESELSAMNGDTDTPIHPRSGSQDESAVEAPEVPGNNSTTDAVANPNLSVDAIRAQAVAETQRITEVRRICGSQHPQIESQAIRDGWDTTRTELEVLRASRPKGPTVLTGRSASHAPSGHVLEAACMLTANLPDLERMFDEQTLDTASRRFRGGIGLQELLLEAAWANGYNGRNFRNSREVLRYAFNNSVEASFSTIDVSGILSNVGNKFLLEGFFSVERTWRNITAIRNVSDFKTVTSYRLVGKDQYEQVAPGGELKHGTLGEEQYANKADTYGLTLSIDRRDIINDDLGAITTIPRKLGRGSGLKINDVFWSTFLNNSSFFKADNKNYLTGGSTALSIDGLTSGETAFMDQVDADGKPIGIMPAILLVPTSLSAVGTTLWKSLEIRDTSASTKYPVANPHQGKFRVEVSRYLANSQYTGNSTKAWYLLSDAADLPVIETAFLNGQESPTIETAEADFNVLGIQMRGYHDFGVALQDPRGGVKAKGEA